MKKLVILLCFSVFICRAEPKNLFENPDKSSEQSVLKTMKDLNKSALDKEISGAVAKILAALIGISIYYAYCGAKKGGQEMRDLFFPNNVELLRKKKIAKRIKIIQTHEELCDSLVKNIFEKKNSKGIPCVCEEVAQKYAVIAGDKSLTKIEEEFREVFRDFVARTKA